MSLSVSLLPITRRFGITGATLFFTLLIIVVSMTITATMMTLLDAGGLRWIMFAILIPLLISPPILFVVLRLIVALDQSNRSLQAAEESLKEMGGLVPVCSCCRKIRDDEAYWDLLEAYLAQNSHFELPHGSCPHCKEEQFDAFLNESENS